jgi:hypothetical protein
MTFGNYKMTFGNLSLVWGPAIFSDITSDLWGPTKISDITSDLSRNSLQLPNLILLNIYNKYDEIFCNDYSIEKYVQQESFKEKNKLV